MMTAKQRLQAFVETIPENATDFEIGLQFSRFQVEAGIRSAQEEPLCDHDEIDGLIEHWLKDE